VKEGVSKGHLLLFYNLFLLFKEEDKAKRSATAIYAGNVINTSNHFKG
jgi:hypothetical protein